jgi:hypothetical protein
MPRKKPSRHTPRIPSGQLFIASDFTLTRVPQTWFADLIMDTSSFIKRAKKATVSEQLSNLCEPQPSGTSTSVDNSDHGEPPFTQYAQEWTTEGVREALQDHPLEEEEAVQEEEEEEEEVVTEEQRPNADDQPNEEVESQSEDEDINTVNLHPLRSPSPTPTPPVPTKRKQQTQRVEVKTKKTKGVSMSLACLLFMMLPIRIDGYGEAYRKFSRMAKTKANQKFMMGLHLILHYWGQCASVKNNCSRSLQSCLKDDCDQELYMIAFPASLQGRLSDWLIEFTTPKAGGSGTSSTATSAHCSSDTTSRAPHYRTTSTSSTTADGRVPPAVASPLPPYPGLQASADGPNLGGNYRPKTSGMLRSMCWQDTTYRYTLRSAANDGDRIIKLEVYNAHEVLGLPSQDWWKSAECRAFVMVNRNSQAANTAVQLKNLLQQTLEADPNHEGDYQRLRF